MSAPDDTKLEAVATNVVCNAVPLDGLTATEPTVGGIAHVKVTYAVVYTLPFPSLSVNMRVYVTPGVKTPGAITIDSMFVLVRSVLLLNSKYPL